MVVDNLACCNHLFDLFHESCTHTVEYEHRLVCTSRLCNKCEEKQMKKAVNWLVGLIVAVLLWGCAATPIKQEVSLPSQEVGKSPTIASNSRMVIFNDSNSLLYGIDGSGKINVSIDAKGVGQLAIGQYVVIEVASGKHVVSLMHKDIMDFNSSHNIDVSGAEVFFKIYSQMTSNGAGIVDAPKDFPSKYKPAY